MSVLERVVPSGKASVTVTPLDAALGATVDCGNLAQIDDAGRAAIREAFLDHLILVFPGQSLSDDEQISMTSIFGTLGDSVKPGMDLGRQKVVTITNVGENPILGNGELFWHSDHSFEERPILASLLHALEVPAVGGDTYWNNMYLAYETLPADLRKRIHGLTIKNDISINSAGQRVERVPETTDVRLSKGPSHPIVRTHPDTGFNALYLGRRPFAYVNGLSVEESEDLLNTLWAHATNPAFAYRHHWTAGDLVVWDNRAVMHKRDAFDETLRRVMHRTQTRGDIPAFDPAADDRGTHPRGRFWTGTR